MQNKRTKLESDVSYHMENRNTNASSDIEFIVTCKLNNEDHKSERFCEQYTVHGAQITSQTCQPLNIRHAPIHGTDGQFIHRVYHRRASGSFSSTVCKYS